MLFLSLVRPKQMGKIDRKAAADSAWDIDEIKTWNTLPEVVFDFKSPHVKFSTSTEQKTKAERKCPHIISDVKIRIEMKHVMHKSCKIRFFSASPCPSSLSATCFNIPLIGRWRRSEANTERHLAQHVSLQR